MKAFQPLRATFLFAGLLAASRFAAAQNPTPPQTPPQTQPQTQPQTPPDHPLTVRQTNQSDQDLMAQAAEAVRINKLARINGVPYDQPSAADTFHDYVRDTYGWPAALRTSVRVLYSQARGKPSQWNFAQRAGSGAGVTVINGNVRYAMEVTFHEDLRYLPCSHCTTKAKLENALLAEITARHSDDGHRFFTLTPTVADFSGPILAHSLWYPNGADPLQGVISSRLIFATRIGGHLFQEFVLDRLHPKLKPQN